MSKLFIILSLLLATLLSGDIQPVTDANSNRSEHSSAFFPNINAKDKTVTNEDGTADSSSEDEFAGPFASWTTITATGVPTKDVANLQTAFNALGDRGSPVLYLVGNFSISSTIQLTQKTNVAVIGAPGCTLTWKGRSEGTILKIVGVAYSRFSRITFDGNNSTWQLVAQFWNGSGIFDTGNEYSDCVFMNSIHGLTGGYERHGFAETTVTRCSFLNLRGAALATGNQNALNLWVWDSYFNNVENCYTNIGGAGNVHMYRNIIKNVSGPCISTAFTEGFSFRQNYVDGCRGFISSQYSQNSCQYVIQDNIIRNCNGTAISVRNHGPVILLDNKIQSNQSPVVYFDPDPEGDVISIGNSYSSTKPITVTGTSRSYSYGDTYSKLIIGKQPEFKKVSWPARQIIEVTSSITAAISRAQRYIGAKPIVHVPFGKYNESITVNGDIQLIGDAQATIITGKVTLLDKATVKDINFKGPGLVIKGNLYANQLQSFFSHIQANSGNHVIVNSGIAYSPASITSLTINSGEVYFFAAQGAGEGTHITLDGGNVFATDYWFEAGGNKVFAKVPAGSNVVINGARISTVKNSTPPVLTNSGGKLVVIGSNIDDRIVASAHTLALGVFIQQSPYLVTTDTSKARLLFSRFRPPNIGSAKIINKGAVESAFIETMLRELRLKKVPSVIEESVKIFRCGVAESQILIN